MDNEMMVSVRVAGVERVVASTAGPLRCGVGFGSQDGATTVEAFGAKAAAGGKTEIVTKAGSTVVWLDDPAQYNHNVAAVVRVAGETVPLRPRLTATTAKTGPTGIELERWAGLTVAHPKWLAADAWLPGIVACDDPGPSARPACAV